VDEFIKYKVMYWILTVMLTYGAVDVTITKELVGDSASPTVYFSTEAECQDFLYDNKVFITEDLFKHFKKQGTMELTGFDYFCEFKN
tara:strand:+ start:15278 stop:15538 length:261 start_codon:yes stop_codon:yes gene_type:complete